MQRIWLLLAAARALRPDANMAATYKRLAERCVALRDSKKRQVWIGITGGPGAGKSTVAEAVAQCCNDLGVRATALPMDGFHFSKEKLRELDPPDAATLLPLRGAPQTFDAEAFCAAVADAREDWTVRRVADLFAGAERPRGGWGRALW